MNDDAIPEMRLCCCGDAIALSLAGVPMCWRAYEYIIHWYIIHWMDLRAELEREAVRDAVVAAHAYNALTRDT